MANLGQEARFMRTKYVAGNWKMFTTRATARALASAVVKGVGDEQRVRVGLFPPFPYLRDVAEVVAGSRVVVGAQNLYPEKEGAFTGEVSPTMLLDVGCQYVILGHSERRHVLGETDTFINRKVHAALAAGLQVIFCVGETLAQRDAGQTEEVLDGQLTAGLVGVALKQPGPLVIAYEPVWAIGTGRNATPEQAQQAQHFIRARMAKLLGEEVAAALVIQYGGSVKPENVASLLSRPDVDGALVGGASLKAEQFLTIVRAAVL
jgi:triosephosphate isomerase